MLFLIFTQAILAATINNIDNNEFLQTEEIRKTKQMNNPHKPIFCASFSLEEIIKSVAYNLKNYCTRFDLWESVTLTNFNNVFYEFCKKNRNLILKRLNVNSETLLYQKLLQYAYIYALRERQRHSEMILVMNIAYPDNKKLAQSVYNEIKLNSFFKNSYKTVTSIKIEDIKLPIDVLNYLLTTNIANIYKEYIKFNYSKVILFFHEWPFLYQHSIDQFFSRKGESETKFVFYDMIYSYVNYKSPKNYNVISIIDGVWEYCFSKQYITLEDTKYFRELRISVQQQNSTELFESTFFIDNPAITSNKIIGNDDRFTSIDEDTIYNRRKISDVKKIKNFEKPQRIRPLYIDNTEKLLNYIGIEIGHFDLFCSFYQENSSDTGYQDERSYSVNHYSLILDWAKQYETEDRLAFSYVYMNRETNKCHIFRVFYVNSDKVEELEDLFVRCGKFCAYMWPYNTYLKQIKNSYDHESNVEYLLIINYETEAAEKIEGSIQKLKKAQSIKENNVEGIPQKPAIKEKEISRKHVDEIIEESVIIDEHFDFLYKNKKKTTWRKFFKSRSMRI